MASLPQAPPGTGAAVPVARPAPPAIQRVRRRRRPSGEPPPLPRHLNASGKWWLGAQRARRGRLDRRRRHGQRHRLRRGRHPGAAGDRRRPHPVADPRRGGRRGPRHRDGPPRPLAGQPGSCWSLSGDGGTCSSGSASASSWSTSAPRMASTLQRPRPYEVEILGPWAGFSMPSLPMTVLSAFLVSTVYALDPRRRGSGRSARWVIGGLLVVTGAVPALPGPGPPDRRPRRGHPRRRRPAGGLPAAHPQRRLPRPLQARPAGPPRRDRRPRATPSSGPCRTSSG